MPYPSGSSCVGNKPLLQAHPALEKTLAATWPVQVYNCEKAFACLGEKRWLEARKFDAFWCMTTSCCGKGCGACLKTNRTLRSSPKQEPPPKRCGSSSSSAP